MRSQLQGVQLRIQTAKSQEAMTGAMKNTGAIMKSMAQQMNMPKLNKIMMEFAKENEKMEMTQEMIGDTMDDVMEPDQDEEEEERMSHRSSMKSVLTWQAQSPKHPPQQLLPKHKPHQNKRHLHLRLSGQVLLLHPLHLQHQVLRILQLMLQSTA